MSSLATLLKGWIFDKGAKIAAGAGAVAMLLDVIERVANSNEPARLCIELGPAGGLLFLAGLLVWVAFKSDPPPRP